MPWKLPSFCVAVPEPSLPLSPLSYAASPSLTSFPWLHFLEWFLVRKWSSMVWSWETSDRGQGRRGGEAGGRAKVVPAAGVDRHR